MLFDLMGFVVNILRNALYIGAWIRDSLYNIYRRGLEDLLWPTIAFSDIATVCCDPAAIFIPILPSHTSSGLQDHFT
ncbi:unnamed protein product [Brugia pahangi]|uniref:Bestrophin homolog n=1 Tax=Brugia pahangi TaxID=6280 RepID=A0A0N4TW98_BRUPA|nr:unnamed protein product [Brugia pahangi]